MKIILVKQAGKHLWGKIDNSLKHEQKPPADLNSGSAVFKHDSMRIICDQIDWCIKFQKTVTAVAVNRHLLTSCL